MIQISAPIRVLVALERVDGRKRIDSYEAHLLLAAGDVSHLSAAPMWRRVST